MAPAPKIVIMATSSWARAIVDRREPRYTSPRASVKASGPQRPLVRDGAKPIRIVGTLMSRLKTGGRLIRHARYFTLQLAESYLTGSLFRQILQRVEQLTWHPT